MHLFHATHVRYESEMRIIVVDLCETSILAGALNGQMAFTRLLHAANPEPREPEPLFLDFADVEVATASFLREAVFVFKAHLRLQSSNFYPVVVNIDDAIRDELDILAEAKNDVLLVCDLDSDDLVSGVKMVGRLDPKQEITFDLVQNLEEVNASGLMERLGDQEKTTSVTAWNNRLAGLVSRGVIREFTRGRSKTYRPLLKGGINGS